MGRVDPGLIRAWLAARSLSRDLPAPVDDHGGWRVDTNLPTETRRHVFAAAGPGLVDLGKTITAPLILLKLAGSHAELAALLPAHWQLEPLAHVMVAPGRFGDGIAASPPTGYRIELDRDDRRAAARLIAPDGGLAASGHAAELDGVFIYDRIVTDPAHRRRGLGRALMLALQTTRRAPAARQILTATAEGEALYRTLGWEVLTPWSTAAIRAEG
jgi:GNAT superfamily N-acetyltransferase